MASDEGDIIMHSKLKKMPAKKQPRSPTSDILKNPERKVSTKEMVNTSLLELKSRKGTSLYAIKKFISEKYQVDAEKISYIIKKYLKTAVEAGTIIQIKGIGASGSFKLATIKNKIEKKKEIKKIAKKMSKPSDKEESKPTKGKNKEKSKEKKIVKEKPEKKNDKKVEVKKVDKKEKILKKDKQEKPKPEGGKEKKTKSKMALARTPAKKRADIIKRKSMGSIIKPPKMKPKIKK